MFTRGQFHCLLKKMPLCRRRTKYLKWCTRHSIRDLPRGIYAGEGGLEKRYVSRIIQLITPLVLSDTQEVVEIGNHL